MGDAAPQKEGLNMHRFFVPRKDIQDKKGTVTGGELEHLRRVLRLRPGERVTLFDDEGWEHAGIVRSYTASVGEIEILESYQPKRESSLDITLAQALGKGEKMDLVVEKATELGVRTIVPFLSSHTVPRLDSKKIEGRHARWKKIALSAAKQSGRTRIPEILDLSDFGGLVHRPWPCELKLLFWEKESLQGLDQIRGEKVHLGSLLLVIGPEGGFSQDEASEAMRHGFQSIRLGRRILRTETAALAALSIVQFLWGDMG
ncbi:MAG: 16S rRNA (uracil(1498)-N(3))-methyltransferase [Candidatus Binatia bacterium]